MVKYFQKKFALSKEGSVNLKNSVISHTFHNISLMLPMMLAFIFILQYGGKILNIETPQYSLTFYLVYIAISFIVMFIIARIDYKLTFSKIYDESAKNRIKLAEKLRKLPLSYFSQKDVADLSATIMSDATSIETLFSHVIPQLIASFISVTIIGIMLFVYNWRMSIVLFWVVPLSLLIFTLSRKKQKKLHKSNFDKNRAIIDSMQDSFDLVSQITSYNLEDEFINDMDNKLDDIHKDMKKGEVVLGSFVNLAIAILKIGIGSVVFFGALLLNNNSIDLMTYIVFLVMSASIYNPFMEIINNLAAILFLDRIKERIIEIDNMEIQTGSTEFNPKNYDIKFENVEFAYKKDVGVLNDISFTAKQGEITALVGPSGCGKTTATKCAARFWDIDKGVITIGGIDISKIDPEKLLENFSIVFQDVTLFNSSIMENIRLGRKDATDEEVIKVAKLAKCSEFIEALPDKYDTLIGENGEKLSGGERQRLSIARALLKDAPIILLDEATASLDAENETEIQAAISELVKDKTVIIIAHRMRTIINADKIIVLQNGKIVEEGNADKLLENKKVFYNMYNSQLNRN